MKILFTAFRGSGNTSSQLLNKLEVNSLFLTNSFSGLEKDIHAITESYDAIYMFGVDKHLIGEVRVEKCAKLFQSTLYSEFDVHPLSHQMNMLGIKHHISDSPTQYLCNSAYYQMLCKNSNTIFIHIPSAKGMDDDLMSRLYRLLHEIVS